MTDREKINLLTDLVKKELSEVPRDKRTVANWNLLRESLKPRFPKEVIKALDASGYISQWIKS